MTLPSKPDVTRSRVLVSYSMFFTQLAWPCNEQTFEFSLRRSHNAIVVSSEQVANKRLSKNLQGTVSQSVEHLTSSTDINLKSKSFLLASALQVCSRASAGILRRWFKASRCHPESFILGPVLDVDAGCACFLFNTVSGWFKTWQTHLMLFTQSSWASVRVLMCLEEMGSNSRTSVCSQATVRTDLSRAEAQIRDAHKKYSVRKRVSLCSNNAKCQTFAS